jgi:hypothetical protein
MSLACDTTGSWATRSKKRGAPVEAAVLAGQGGREVEAEPVDVHLHQPVAERVHDQLQAECVAGVERVAAAGGVDVEAEVLGVEPVVGGLSTPRWQNVGPGVVALGRVVEHHVEDHVEAGAVEGVDHRLELGHLAAGPAGADLGRIAVVGGEEADRCCIPSSSSAPAGRGRPRDALVHGQQLDRL